MYNLIKKYFLEHITNEGDIMCNEKDKSREVSSYIENQLKKSKVSDEQKNILKEYIKSGTFNLIKAEELAEKLSFKVVKENFNKKYDDSDISGAIIYDKENEEKRFILVDKYDRPSKQMFTIMHELAHYFLHQDIMEDYNNILISFRGRTNGYEDEADDFASHILVSDEEIKEYAKDNSLPLVVDLVEKYNISRKTAKYRAERLGIRLYGV